MSNFIDIEVNGEFLDLSDASVRLERVNPMLIQEIYQGDYSFPFEAPATEKNLRILKYANFIDISNRTIDYDAFMFIYGIPQGKLKLRVTKGRKRSLSIVLSAGIKALKTADKKLSELDLGPDYVLGNSQNTVMVKVKTVSLQSLWSVYGFTFVPFRQNNFYGLTNPAFNGVVNRQDSVNGNFASNNNIVGNAYTIVPWLFLFYVLDKIFKAENLTPQGSFWMDKECQKILLYNNYALDGNAKDTNTKVITDAAKNFNAVNQIVEFKHGPSGSFDNLGGWVNASFKYTVKAAGTFYVDVEIETEILNIISYPGPYFQPTFYLVFDGVDKVAMKFGGGVGTVQRKNLTWQLVATPADINKQLWVRFHLPVGATPYPSPIIKVNPSSFLSVTEDSLAPINYYDNKVTYKNHVPDFTVGELLSEVKKMGVFIDIDYQSGKINLERVDQLLNSSDIKDLTTSCDPDYELTFEDQGKGLTAGYDFSAEDNSETIIDPLKFVGEYFAVEDLPNPSKQGNYAIVTQTNTVYQVVKNGSSYNSWKAIGDNYAPYKIGNGESKLVCKLAPMTMCLSSNINGTIDENAALMPEYFGSGSSPLFGLGINSFKPKIVFYRGLNINGPASTQRGGKYILASTTNYGINRNKVGDLSLRLDKSDGIIRAFNDRLFNAINNSEVVEKDLTMEAKDILTFKTYKKASFDYNVYIVKNITINVSKMFSRMKGLFLKI